MRLVFLCVALILSVSATNRIHDPGILEFTAFSYNLSISERWTVNATAWSDSAERVGAYIPRGYSVKFKIVKGDKDQIFQSTTKKVGNFAFLSIGVKSDQILNRELQDEFQLVIKATARRKNEATQEAQAIINLRVLDDNDLFPFFRESEYTAKIDDQFPVNGQIIRLEGVDADVGLNGQIYYSLLTPSNYFYVEPLSGWVRSFSRLTSGTYSLTCQVEDRSSRLFYNQHDSSMPFFRNQVTLTITVSPSDSRPPKLSAQPIPLRFYTTHQQPAALLTIADVTDRNVNVELSEEIQARGDTFLQRQSSNTFLLSVARVTNTAPRPISLIVRDLSQPNETFTAENVPLEMSLSERRVWFNGATDEDTPRIRLKVDESVPVDYVVFTFDANTTFVEDQKHVKYRIHGKEGHKLPFHLDKINGQLRMKGKLNYADKSLYEISVVAKLEGVEEKAFLDVFIDVLDSNNNCPVFKELPEGFQVKVKTKSAGTEVYKVQAEDLDNAENAQVSYKLIGINDTHFSVDPLSGNLKISKDLPANEHKWTVKLMAIDSGFPLPNFATTLLQIVSNDGKSSQLTAIESLFDTCSMKNENAPKFVDSQMKFEVNEDTLVGSTIGYVKATDADQGYNGLIGYTTLDSYVGIDLLTGRLFVQKQLFALVDGQKKDHVLHEIEVTARDHSFETSKSSTTKTRIQINDVNNNAPEFEKHSYTVKVSENSIPSEELFRLKAKDLDNGANGRVEYRLAIETDTIFVDPDSGSVRLERALDREQQDKHQFLLMAVDRGKPPKFAFTNLTLLVEDTNDNSPVCGKPLHSAKLFEDAPSGQLVLCMASSDMDLGENAKLEYSMSDEDNMFRIDRQSGCIFTNLTKPLDYEIQNTHGFNVTVRDSGTPRLSTTCPVEIKLVDVNENHLPPRFTETIFEGSIEENKPKHTEILTVQVVEGLPVNYELVDGDGLGYFELDKETGILRTSTVIDYERTPQFWLTVRAINRDKTNALFSYSHIYIRIINVADQRLLFSQPIYFPSVVENSEPNKVVLRLNVTDRGVLVQNSAISPVIKYTIERGNAQSNFMLDENTGYLVTGQRHLDREAQSQHELYIQACDQERLCSSVLVVVNVLDQNDNTPKFKEDSFNLTVPANQSGFFTRVFANDADEDGPNSDLTYSLENNSNTKITIDKFGRLFATEPLAAQTSIQLTVVAEDNGTPRLRSTASVRLNAIAPVSKSAQTNKAPSFQNLAHWHHLYLSDNDAVGTMLGRIEATDPDNDPLWFRIVDESTNPNETFAFQSASGGELVLARRAELIGTHLRKIELTIAVTDGFAEIRDKVFIHVTRSSLARPRFEQTEAFVDLQNDHLVGYILHTAKAHFDETNTGISHPHQLTYAIHYVTDVLAAESLRIDASNGNLILEKPLNEAVATNFSVVILAKIGGGQENYAVVHVHKKEPNHPPKFLFDEYRFQFYLINNEVGSIFAYDIDSGLNGQVVYSILSGNEDGYFVLNAKNGEITLHNSTNNMPSEFTLTVRAIDSAKLTPLSTTCTVYLNKLVNESNAKPEFRDANQLIILDEQTKSQQTVIVLDSTSDSFVSYFTDCDSFNVKFGSGLVQLQHELGSENFGQTLNCSFFAHNSMNNQTTKLLVHIKTTQKDRALIRFEFDEYNGAIKELTTRGSPVYTSSNFSMPIILRASVLNGQAGQLRYRLLSPQESYFTVDSTSGALRVAEPISFEMHKNWELNAIAHNNHPSNPKGSQPIQVHIQVVDTNNQPPKFTSNLFELELLLPTTKNTLVGQINAEDIDLEELKYSLKATSKFQSLFQIDSNTGILRVATNDTKLFEEREYKLDVQVSDGLHTTTGKVLVKTLTNDKLLRRADSLKLHKQQYIVHTTENRTKAIDTQRPLLTIDWPLNAHNGETFDFRIISELNGKLSINPISGLVYLNASNPLDREEGARFEMVVLIKSRQNAQRYAQTIVQVNVNDINDCAPMFDQNEYTILVSEDAKMADKLIQIKATDLDLGTNGVVRYSLANDAPDFLEINSNDGRLLVKSQPLNDQLVIGREYQFHVVATDQGSPSLSSKALVRVQIIDRNQPIFEQSSYKAKIKNSPIETPILHVKAKSNTNGELAYLIVDGDPLRQFDIGFRDGRLLLNDMLDRERQDEYQLKVQVVDLSRHNVSAIVTIYIEVEDVNDSSPVFEQDIYKFSINEQAPIGTLIGQVKAIDHDLMPVNNQLSYQLVNGNKSILSVDSLSGQIYLASTLDYEKEKFMEFTITANDVDSLSGQTILQLTIEDANDNEPKFVDKSPLQLNIQATDHFDDERFLYLFKVNDLNTVNSLGSSSNFHYSIENGDDTFFKLNAQNGILTQTRAFDEKELEKFASGEKLQKQLNISVFDGLFEDRLQVLIVFQPTASQIEPLQFNSLINSVFLNENRLITNKTVIETLKVHGGRKPYLFSTPPTNGSWPLFVHPTTGHVYLTNKIGGFSEFFVPFTVMDANQQLAFTRLSIHIKQDNKNAPKFVTLNDEYQLYVSITASEGDQIAKVVAEDADKDDSLEFTLVDFEEDSWLNPLKYFSLDLHTGYLTVQAPIPANLVGQKLEFSVKVIDQNNPPHHHTVPFRLHITDAPVPEFSRLHFYFAVSENSEIGTLVGQLTTNEQSPKELTYEMSENAELSAFALDKLNGRLTLRSKLDRETKEQHQFVVKVQNAQELSSFCFVSLAVIDINDNPPKFMTQIDRVYVSESVRPGSIVNVFYAIDLDQGLNGQVEYELKNNENNTFRIDRDYGWLFVVKPLDREQKTSYNLTVVAKDGGGLTTEMSFQLIIRDTNDNAPSFEKPAYSLNLKQQDCRVGQKLLRLNVNDADTNEVQSLSISLVANEHSKLLKLVGNELLFDAMPTTNSSFNATFKLIAFDGIHSTISDLNVQWIAAKNDFCTQTTQTIHISSNRPVNSSIMLLNKDNRQFLIHHLLGAEKLPFEIVNNSELVVKEGFYKLPKYELCIKSIQNLNNMEQSCVHRYNVSVDSANRMAPHFDLRNFTVHVAENSNASNEKRQFLIRLPATDEDFGLFGQLTYELRIEGSTKNADQYFEVHAQTGAVLLKKPLDRETHEKFDLQVKVTDGGGLSDVANLTLLVEDVNDNFPKFEQAVINLKILENEPIDYVLYTLKATDNDIGGQKLTFHFNDSKAPDRVPGREYVELHPDTGVLRLIQSFDYEKIQSLSLEVFAQDNGDPPLESKAVVNLHILDLNDNSPVFDQPVYETSVKENQPIGTRVLKVMASDKDSEHFGKVSYEISGDDDADFLTVTDDGWIELAKPIDYESKKILRAKIIASDGGMPALTDSAMLSIGITDTNDNPPIFKECQLNAVIQEGIPAGQSLLTVQLTDEDSPENGPPFRLEIHGDGASAFTFDPNLNLINTRLISEQREYNLNVTAFDAHGLSTTCPLRISVKKQSRHAPEVRPLLITINTLYGEFLGSKVGQIRAVDKDQGDLLRFSIIESVNHAPSTSFSFDHSKLQSTALRVNTTTGELDLAADILTGLHRFNVSVTDGKFVIHTPVTIDVANIDQEALDYSISMQLSGLNAENFIQEHMQKFIGILSRLLSVPLTYVRILSVQDVEKSRSKRQTHPSPTVIAQPPQISTSEIELLLTVSRGESRGYHRPSFVKQRISEGIAQLTAETGLEISSLTSEVCRSDTCSKGGECRDRLWLDNVNLLHINDDKTGNSYLFPKFVRTYDCICRQGFGGQNCDVSVNKCSRDVCTKYEMCVPNDNEPTCMCPPGLKGDRCATPACEKPSECSQKESLSLLGNGYFQVFIAQSMESRMELLVEFKTISRNAYLMHGSGHKDFHGIVIEDGYVEYRWDCGTGIGQVKIAHIRVDDGKFHNLKVVRRGRQVKLILDGHQAEGASPPGSDVVNLYSQATILTFGAQIHTINDHSTNRSNWIHHRQHHHQRQAASELASRIVQNGTIGCFSRIGIDGFDLPKDQGGLRMFNARIGCNAQTIGACLTAPCKNNGQCMPKEEVNSYSCLCSERYTGSHCEIDLNMCEDHPCPKSVNCHNLYNDFHCACPVGFTGKTCQLRGWDDGCSSQPCGPYGKCVPFKSSFICNCSDGFGGQLCADRVPKMAGDNWSLQSPELYILFGIFLTAFLCAILAIIVCRRQNRAAVGGKNQGSLRADNNSDRLPSTDDPTNALIPATPRIAPPIYQNTVERPPPPLPPKNSVRIPRSNNQTLLSSGLPTVEVRPMQSIHHMNRRTEHACCPTPPQSFKGSLSSAMKCSSNPYDDTYEETPKPAPPPHRFIMDNDESAALLARGVIVKNPGKKQEKNASNPATSMSSLDNSSGDYLTMKPIAKKKTKNSDPKNNEDPPKTENGAQNGVH